VRELVDLRDFHRQFQKGYYREHECGLVIYTMEMYRAVPTLSTRPPAVEASSKPSSRLRFTPFSSSA
jgi:uncharacterized protein YfbU (UPF0304 family)